MPAFTPFTCHWYDGLAPPLVGVAVKVTVVPEQILLADGDMLTLTGRFGLTVATTDILGLLSQPDDDTAVT